MTALVAIYCFPSKIGVREPIFISHPKIFSKDIDRNGYRVETYIKKRSRISNDSVNW
jgi:hypothetical protein